MTSSQCFAGRILLRAEPWQELLENLASYCLRSLTILEISQICLLDIELLTRFLANWPQRNEVIKLTIAPSMMAKNALVSKEDWWEELVGNILKKIWSDICLDVSVCKNVLFVLQEFIRWLWIQLRHLLSESVRKFWSRRWALRQSAQLSVFRWIAARIHLPDQRIRGERTHEKTPAMIRS